MADEPEVIRHQMEAQRASLEAKLETLENVVTEKMHEAKTAVQETVHEAKDLVQTTVQEAKSAVNETVCTVRATVQDTVDTVRGTVHTSVVTVKETFDVPLQVERHPWVMFGGAVAVGYVAGLALCKLTAGAERPRAVSRPPAPPQPHRYTTGLAAPAGPTAPMTHPESVHHPEAAAPQAEPGPSWTDSLAQSFAPELQKLKGMAIGALMGVVRDMVEQSTPEPLRQQVHGIADDITTKLGGQPIQGNVLEKIMPQRPAMRPAADGPSCPPFETYRP